jgi:hypothetical protein
VRHVHLASDRNSEPITDLIGAIKYWCLFTVA